MLLVSACGGPLLTERRQRSCFHAPTLSHQEDAARSDEAKSHAEQVWDWVEENLERYPTPRRVTLYAFEIDWNELRGAFNVMLDEQAFPHRLDFHLGVCGRVGFQLPMFVSPLGAPASCAAVELTDPTDSAISKALLTTIPKVLGLGLNRKTGRGIDGRTPILERAVDAEAFLLARAKASVPGYSITVETGDA